jgi:polysaccharide transporter, PST family
MTFGRVMVWGVVQSAVRLAAGLATTKLLAVYLGPAGLALFAQFQTFTAMLNNFSNGGIQQGVVKYTAELKDDPKRLADLNRTAALLALAAPALLGIPLLLWRTELASWLFKEPALDFVIAVYASVLILVSIGTTLGAQLTGLHHAPRYFAAQAAFALLSLAFAAAFTPALGLTGALLSIPASHAALLAVYVACTRGVAGIGWSGWRPGFDRTMAKKLLGFAILLLVTALAMSGSQLYVRDLLMRAHSAESAGHWQAMQRVSEPLIIIFTSVLTSYYLPRLSGADQTRRAGLMRHYFMTAFPAFCALSALIVAFREQLVLLMFTSAFLPATALFFAQLSGEVVRMTGWIANIALMAAGRTRIVMVSEIVFAAAYVSGAAAFAPSHGAWAVCMSYLGAMLASATVLWGAHLQLGRAERAASRASK